MSSKHLVYLSLRSIKINKLSGYTLLELICTSFITVLLMSSILLLYQCINIYLIKQQDYINSINTLISINSVLNNDISNTNFNIIEFPDRKEIVNYTSISSETIFSNKDLLIKGGIQYIKQLNSISINIPSSSYPNEYNNSNHFKKESELSDGFLISKISSISKKEFITNIYHIDIPGVIIGEEVIDRSLEAKLLENHKKIRVDSDKKYTFALFVTKSTIYILDLAYRNNITLLDTSSVPIELFKADFLVFGLELISYQCKETKRFNRKKQPIYALYRKEGFDVWHEYLENIKDIQYSKDNNSISYKLSTSLSDSSVYKYYL